MVYKIVKIDFVEYYSELVPKEILHKYLIGSTCNYFGELKLVLKPGRELIVTGPYILPPVRWLTSFEYCAEFIIVCVVKEVDENEEIK